MAVVERTHLALGHYPHTITGTRALVQRNPTIGPPIDAAGKRGIGVFRLT